MLVETRKELVNGKPDGSTLKGAYLVLVWNLLVNLSFATTLLLFSGRFTGYFSSSPLYVSILLIAIVLVCFLVISAPLSGWLADAKLGNLKVHKLVFF